MAKENRRYKIEEKGGLNAVTSGKKTFNVPKIVPLTALVCLFAGLYLAEGSTPKSKVFAYDKERAGDLVMALTASEDDTLSVCMRAISSIINSSLGEVRTWRLKIGAKYYPEAVTLGNKSGVPMLRRGPKGQGAVSSFETVEACKSWALTAMPSLKKVADRFDHLELTGGGIPRVDIFYDDAIAVFLFSIMKNLVVDPLELEKFEVKAG